MYSNLSQTDVTLIHHVWQVRVRGMRAWLKVWFSSVKTHVKFDECWQSRLIKMTAHIHMHLFACSAWRSPPCRPNKGEEGSQGAVENAREVWGDNTHTHRVQPCALWSLKSEVIAVTAGLSRSAWAHSLFSGPPTPSLHAQTHLQSAMACTQTQDAPSCLLLTFHSGWPTWEGSTVWSEALQLSVR